ncbi:MAG: hypothetical protein IT233_07210 [Bacteroidia bacterium]|nr:hypothetical protein [Bacteroidia bacterium]
MATVPSFKIIPPAISSAGLYYFTTDLGIKYEVRFGRRKDNILKATIVFGVINDEFEGEEYVVTNSGELYRVMETINQIIALFMKEHPKMISYEFTGLARENETEDKASARINLYFRYAKRIFDKNWKIEFQGNNTILVSRTGT